MKLIDELNNFVEQCNHDARLREMNADWTRTIRIVATRGAVEEPYWIRSQAGVLEAGEGFIDSADMEIRASEEILGDVFSGAVTPTEPYNAGDLLVKGHPDDMMRLDILTLLIWGE